MRILISLFVAISFASLNLFGATARGIRVNFDTTGTNTIGTSVTIDAGGTILTAAGVVVSGATASLPAKLDGGKSITSGAINLNSAETTGILPASKGGATSGAIINDGTVSVVGGLMTHKDTVSTNETPSTVTAIGSALVAGTVNKVTITTPATAATLTIANNKTATVINTLTFSGTDGSTVAFGTGGTAAYLTTDLSAFAFANALTWPDGVRQVFNPNATVAGINVGAQAGDPSTPVNGDLWYDSTGNLLRARINGSSVSLGTGGGGGGTAGTMISSGTFAVGNIPRATDTSGTNFGPTLLVSDASGNLTATTVNKVTITTPATAATLTIANNKTATVSNTLTFSGTDGSSVAFGTGGTAAYHTDITTSIGITIDGGGSAITTGSKGYFPIAYSGTIASATIIADQSGSIVIEVRKCTYAQFDAGATHPVTGDKINSATPPTISSATKSQDTTLTSWTTAVTAGDIFEYVVNSATTITRATLVLKITR